MRLLKAARALAGLTQQELAEQAEVSVSTIRDFERGFSVLIPATLDALIRALREAGVEVFGPPAGVRFLPDREPTAGDPKTLARMIAPRAPAGAHVASTAGTRGDDTE